MTKKSPAALQVLLLFCAWGFVSMLLVRPGDVADAQAAFALGAVVLGAHMFWTHGGNHATATGLYGLGILIFTGLAGLYWSVELRDISDGLYLATAAGYWTTLAAHLMVLALPRREYRQLGAADPRVTRWGFRFGAVLTLVGAAIMRTGPTEATQFALAGVGMMIVSLILHRPESRGGTVRLAIAGVIVVASALLIFSAFGRLMLVALGLSAIVAACGRADSRLVKVLTLAGIIPVTMALVRFREGAQRELGYQGSEVDGLGSAVSPLSTFGRLIDQNVSDANGEPFIASLLFWVPRSMWEGKPLGLGSALTAELEPQLLFVGHSMAAQGPGEWFFSFGWLGVIAMVPVLTLGLRLLDRLLSHTFGRPLESRRDLVLLLAVIFLVCEVPVLAWSGTFTYTTRGVTKAVIMLIVLALFAWKVSPEPRKSTGARPVSARSRVRRRTSSFRR